MTKKISEAVTKICDSYGLNYYEENYLESLIENIYKDSYFDDLSTQDRALIWEDVSVLLKVKLGETKRVFRVDPRSN